MMLGHYCLHDMLLSSVLFSECQHGNHAEPCARLQHWHHLPSFISMSDCNDSDIVPAGGSLCMKFRVTESGLSRYVSQDELCLWSWTQCQGCCMLLPFSYKTRTMSSMNESSLKCGITLLW